MPGVHVKWQKPQMSVLEGILARGDRRMAALIEQAWKNGCTFDGWNDRFKFDLWQQALEQCELQPEFFTTRQRDLDEPLPWQHMDVRVDADFLKQQWQAALDMERVEDCRHGDCHACGVCDFKTVEPKVFDTISDAAIPDGGEGDTRHETFVWFSLKYTKLKEARFFGHLELSHIFARAVRRAQIEVAYSKGFHPMPKISFDDPLPLGIESEAEYFRIMVSAKHQCQDIMGLMNDHLPEGVRILTCQLRSEAKKERAHLKQRFSVELQNPDLDSGVLKDFVDSDSWPYERTNNKGRVHHIDLRTALDGITIKGGNTLIYDIAPQPQHTIRPADILVGIFKLPADVLQGAKVVKLDRSSLKSAVDNDLPKR